MKIAFIIPINGISGGLYVVYKHAHSLLNAGYYIEILISNDLLGTNIISYPNFQVKTRTLKEAIESQIQYDVVIATWWETFYEMFYLQADHYLYFCQSDERRFYPSPSSFETPFVELTYSDPGVGVITEAKWIRSLLQEEFGLFVEYAPNGVDNSLFNPGVKPLEPRGDRLRILIEGPGSVPFKRVDFAFKVANQFPEIEIWYVSSDGVTLPHWRFDRLFKKLPLDKMPEVYTSCDILLKFSTVEGFFGPPLEMMACGGVVLVGRVTGWDEYIIDGINALTIDLDNEEQANLALQKLIRDPVLRNQLSLEGIRTAQKMDWKKRCPLFEQSIKNLVKLELKTNKKLHYRQNHELRKKLLHTKQEHDICLNEIQSIFSSRSWKLTAPLRCLTRLYRNIKSYLIKKKSSLFKISLIRKGLGMQ